MSGAITHDPRGSDLTPRECLAIRILNDEWTHRELAMCFGIHSQNIGVHARGECTCDVDGLDFTDQEDSDR